jgi:hypothetical protein
MKKAGGILLLLLGVLAMIAPQANLGLTELRWVARYAFPGEALLGIALLGAACYLLGAATRAPQSRQG